MSIGLGEEKLKIPKIPRSVERIVRRYDQLIKSKQKIIPIIAKTQNYIASKREYGKLKKIVWHQDQLLAEEKTTFHNYSLKGTNVVSVNYVALLDKLHSNISEQKKFVKELGLTFILAELKQLINLDAEITRVEQSKKWEEFDQFIKDVDTVIKQLEDIHLDRETSRELKQLKNNCDKSNPAKWRQDIEDIIRKKQAELRRARQILDLSQDLLGDERNLRTHCLEKLNALIEQELQLYKKEIDGINFEKTLAKQQKKAGIEIEKKAKRLYQDISCRINSQALIMKINKIYYGSKNKDYEKKDKGLEKIQEIEVFLGIKIPLKGFESRDFPKTLDEFREYSDKYLKPMLKKLDEELFEKQEELKAVSEIFWKHMKDKFEDLENHYVLPHTLLSERA